MKSAVVLMFTVLAVGDSLNYTYDPAGRLIRIDYGNGSVVAYSYDKAGNLTSRQVQTGGPHIVSVNTAGGGPDIAQNTFIAIKGINLIPASTPASGVIWNDAPEFASGQMPAKLGPVSVTVNNKPAFVYFYCSAATSPICPSDQINVLTPLDNTVGQVQVVVTNGTVSAPPFNVNLRAVSPAFLLFGSQGYVVGVHLDGSLMGPASLYPGLSTPATPSETVALFGVGFGLPTTPLVNGSAMQSGTLPSAVVCQVGNIQATVAAALAGPGLYQFNLTIPDGAPDGDDPIVCSYGGSSTPAGDLITVKR